jgi:GNAT superfamily N-acetyltransferase
MVSGVRTRRVAREEWVRVRELRLRALAESPDAFGSTHERERSLGRPEWIAWIDGWEGATNAMFVAESGDRWIGMAVGSRTGEEADAHLYGMWVDPTWRGAGVGGRLVEGVTAWARSWGARSVILGVTETNDGAAVFYEHLGFADTGERYPLREGSRLTCRTLRREL